MKVTYTEVLSRKMLLAFLAFVIILAISAIFVRNAISNKLERIADSARHIGHAKYTSVKALLLLHQADDDFQELFLTGDTNRSAAYKTKLSLAFAEIDTLIKEQEDTTNLSGAQRTNVRQWYYKKLQLSSRLQSLKLSFDSLLTGYNNFNIAQNKDMPLANMNSHVTTHNIKNSSDTVRKKGTIKKKGFFKRIKDAIYNKNGDASSASGLTEINHNHNNRMIDSVTQRITEKDKNAYSRKLQLLQQNNVKLLSTQKKLIAVNIHISNELERIIDDAKEINFRMENEFTAMAFKSYRDTTLLLNKFYLAALFLLLIFAALLIVFTVKLDKSEILLLNENERSVAIAKQKMDLLLHMSHEIRNPLTAIKSFLYIFSKTEMSSKQAEMLSSIRLSSDMLLHTLNDTLDAAKMESNEIKVNNDPFNPYSILKGVIESMEFSASKKGLNIDFQFTGDEETMLSGDSFRLRQVMVNLLSNAIKYTKTGRVTINTQLEITNEINRLSVDVIDTGTGISQEQQANLFSKYYQTNSAKGNVGTGLGLYICKQLIQFQNGQINVKSKEGFGSTFSFYIPYKGILNTPDNVAETSINNPLMLLNGIKILAIDDNELSLMFLKMMTRKWNIKFHEASNAKEALDIIAKEEITVILTDINAPGMNDNKTLKSIKQTKPHLKQIPIIVIDKDNKSLLPGKPLKNGFSGLITKPYTESDLIKQIILALNL